MPPELQNFCEELWKEIGVRIVLEVWPYVIPANSWDIRI
jgi:hypothetical protein